MEINLEHVINPLEYLVKIFPFKEDASSDSDKMINRIHIACDRALYTIRSQDAEIKRLEDILSLIDLDSVTSVFEEIEHLKSNLINIRNQVDSILNEMDKEMNENDQS